MPNLKAKNGIWHLKAGRSSIPKSYSSVPGAKSSIQFAFDLLEQTGVIVVPGSSFGEQGEGYVRLALVQNEAKILKAIASIQQSGLLK
jgi:LL-diaminopimelate aminotransferase